MYKMLEILNLDRTPKTEAMEQWKSKHSLYGNFYGGYKPRTGECMWFLYNGEDMKALRSSVVNEVDVYDNIVEITTMNSIYVFKEVKENHEFKI